jgi:hypothetical protein
MCQLCSIALATKKLQATLMMCYKLLHKQWHQAATVDCQLLLHIALAKSPSAEKM